MKNFEDIYRINGSTIIKGKDNLDAKVKSLVDITGKWPVIEMWDSVNDKGEVQWLAIN